MTKKIIKKSFPFANGIETIELDLDKNLMYYYFVIYKFCGFNSYGTGLHPRKVNINNSEELFGTLNAFRREIMKKISILKEKYEKSGYI